ncbi:MAG: cbb3-type cytochrome c oxidase subunit II, partial [Proteobacteria bacterium]|nr:cbb3-type cytochrome c oxidase subunit II [Pseudomonadota bacterium]
MGHSWENQPVRFLLLATAAILVGTIITMVLPFAWVNTEEDRIAEVKPYAPLELAGRDVYIREGCNNCHTQTVRPLVAEVKRYGPYSKSGEFVYDRPFLWGSRRAGPDLARIGGKYPDSWHVHHLEAPTAMVPASNMPAYAFLGSAAVDPEYTRRKMEVLDFPYEEAQIQGLQGKTEMDALVAYLQKLGSDIGWRKAAAAEIAGELANPFAGDAAAASEGAALYEAACAACHGAD